MDLVGVRVELPSNTPIVVLRELAGAGRFLSIFIGAPEATAIAFALEDVETPRPLTHDLVVTLLEELDAELIKVVVTELQSTTYFAEIHVEHADGTSVISSRPSDALALASRVGCPIHATESVLADAGYLEEPDGDDDGDSDVNPDEVVEEFRHFIESVDPDDFAS